MSKRLALVFVCLSAIFLICAAVACEAAEDDPHMSSDNDDDDNDDDNDEDTGGDSDGDSDSDSDADSDSDSDADGDGDNDGLLDPDSFCDCEDLSVVTAENLGKAMNICDGVLDLEVWSTSPNPEAGFAILESLGTNDCIVTQHGCNMIAISTGPVGQSNPNDAGGTEFGSDGMANLANDPLPPFQGEQPTTSTPYASCDNLQLRFRLKAPEGAEGFSFDFLYASAEYNEWINMGYNDAFYAILQHSGINGGEPTNISFDDNNNEIEVDVNFFENASHTCDETGSGWEPSVYGVSGSTGWLRTSWPVNEGDEFNLTFSIHDEGDCIYDSIVFIDNFQWHGEVVDPGTAPV